MRIPFFIVTLCLLVWCAQSAHAQRSLGFSVDVTPTHSKDELVSPQVYSGTIAGFNLASSLRRSNRTRQTNLAFLIGSTNHSRNVRTIRKMALQHRLEWEVSHSKFAASVGPVFGAELLNYPTTFKVSGRTYDGKASGLLSFYTGVSVTFKYPLKYNWIVSARPILPLLSYYFRPGYTSGPPQELVEDYSLKGAIRSGSVSGINSAFQPKLDIVLGKESVKKIRLVIAYRMEYYAIRLPQPMKLLQHTFRTGLVWMW